MSLNASQLTPEERGYLVQAMQNDYALFATTVMGHIVEDLPTFQREMYDSFSKNYSMSAYVCFRGSGKRLSLNAKILTPDGWKLNGTLSVGDQVIGSNGKPTTITAISAPVYRPLYRLSTRDGRSVLCDEEHQWKVERISGGAGFYKNKHIVMTTRELIEFPHATYRVDKRDGKAQLECFYAIKNPAPVEFEAKRYEIDPYDLGVILGDGGICCNTGYVRIHSSCPDVYEIYSHMTWPHKGEIICCNDRNAARFSLFKSGDAMRKLDLVCNVYAKHIPEAYLYGSIEQRLALLQGLMDTDGTSSSSPRSGASFSTVSKPLAEGVVQLVRSLGGSAFVGTQHPPLGTTVAYRINIILPDCFNPFKLSRKAHSYTPGRRTANAIVSIEYEKHGLGQCIEVDAEDHLFIAEDFLLTHNSTISKPIQVTHDLCYAKFPYTMLISESEDQASADLISIQDEIFNNELLLELFGNNRGNITNTEALELANGCYVRIKGVKGRARGYKWKNRRPTKLILDDFESEHNTESDDMRNQVFNWVFRVIKFMGEPGKTQIQFFNTIVHPDSFMAKAVDMPFFKRPKGFYMSVPAMTQDAEGNWSSAWEAQFPVKELIKDRAEYYKIGQGVSWDQELLNIPAVTGRCIFKTEKLLPLEGATFDRYKSLTWIEKDGKKIPIRVYMGLDPAASVKESSDDTCGIVIGVPPINNSADGLFDIIILDVIAGKYDPSQQPDLLFKAKEKYSFVHVTIETNAYQLALPSFLRQMMAAGRSPAFSIVEFRSAESKNNKFLKGLEPFINGGHVSYLPGCNHIEELIHQMNIFNTGSARRKDDLVDALYLALNQSYPSPRYDVEEALKREKDTKKKMPVYNWRTI